MSGDRFMKIQKCVTEYFDKCISHGQEPIEIMEAFREDPMPEDILSCGFSSNEIKRHGQLVGSQYIIKQKQSRAELPKDDLLAVE